MTELNGYQIESMVAFLANLVFVSVTVIAIGTTVRKGFTNYPWPEWSVRLGRRVASRLTAKVGR